MNSCFAGPCWSSKIVPSCTLEDCLSSLYSVIRAAQRTLRGRLASAYPARIRLIEFGYHLSVRRGQCRAPRSFLESEIVPADGDDALGIDDVGIDPPAPGMYRRRAFVASKNPNLHSQYRIVASRSRFGDSHWGGMPKDQIRHQSAGDFRTDAPHETWSSACIFFCGSNSLDGPELIRVPNIDSGLKQLHQSECFQLAQHEGGHEYGHSSHSLSKSISWAIRSLYRPHRAHRQVFQTGNQSAWSAHRTSLVETGYCW